LEGDRCKVTFDLIQDDEACEENIFFRTYCCDFCSGRATTTTSETTAAVSFKQMVIYIYIYVYNTV